MHIEDYAPGRLDDVSELADRVMGVAFFENPSQIMSGPDEVLLLAVEKDDSLAGFVRGRLLPAGELDAFVDNQVDAMPEDLQQADRDGVLGVIQTVVVSPEQQGQGVGTKLMRAAHDTLVGIGADKLIVTFKRGPRVPHVDAWMEKLGFDFWTKLASFWKTRCDNGEFHCSERRDSCNCEAMFYRKRVF